MDAPTRRSSRLARILCVVLLAGAFAISQGVVSQDTKTASDGKKPASDPPSAGESSQETGAETPALPPGIYARVNGRDVTQREYAEYLLASIGKSHLGLYIDRILIESEARKEGISVAPEEIEKLLEERIQRTVQGIYRGSLERFVDELKKRNRNLEEYKQRERQDLYYGRLLESLILKSRKVDDAAIRGQFEEVYGPGGVRHELRHILISTGRRIGQDGKALAPRPQAEAEARAKKVHAELLAGGDFIQLVKRYSDDPFTRQNDGRLPVYRKGDFGAEFDGAVEKLSKESPNSGTVRSKKGWHLIQLIERRVTKLEDVRAEVEKLVRQRPPSSKERQAALRALREAAEIIR